MKKYILVTVILFLGMLCLAKSSLAAIIFQSRWDSPNATSYNIADDGGKWHYAYPDCSAITMERVSGDQSGAGGPTGAPPGGNSTYFLRETWVAGGTDCGAYLQANFDTQYQNMTDYYGGMWVYFQNGLQFIDSVKFFDFRTSGAEAGNGHLALFGLDHDSMG